MSRVPAIRRFLVMADLTWVSGGAMTANVTGYLLQVLAGRWLGVSGGFSEFASLLALQLLCAVPALALQNVVARDVVGGAGVAQLRGLQWRCAAVVAVAAALVTPLVAGMLQVGVAAAAAALAAAPALVLLAGEQGILQGNKQFRALGVVLGTAGIARVGPALVILALGGGVPLTLLAATCGIVAAAVCARMIAGEPATRARGELDRDDVPVARVRPVLWAAQVQAALMALSSADLLVVRIVLEEADASRYAFGTIATKIAFWLPQAVGVVLYPRMAQPTQSASAIRVALAVLSGIGLTAVLGAALAAPLAPLLAGPGYAPVQDLLWLFALHGAVLAVLQGAVLSAIAIGRTSLAAFAWLGLAVEIVAMVVLARSIPAVLVTAVSVAACTTVVVAAVVVRAADTTAGPDPLRPVS
ncbi:polysaccharide biosynthesis protein [Nocardia sp. CNY236]|uniref:polysaccharide biosynthesis protein n=1 Tax=Nocardia sp. CNY236 TaxID=1169152 RepID=UPI0004297862|nr:polysaccharide biosynthesis protein [Nocardia sp. CNY236]